MNLGMFIILFSYFSVYLKCFKIKYFQRLRFSEDFVRPVALRGALTGPPQQHLVTLPSPGSDEKAAQAPSQQEELV